MTDSIIQHIENEKQPYRIPVFTIKPSTIHFSDKVEKTASVVRLTTCDFITNYYNVSYTNNCLRWIRIPTYENNELLSSTAPEDPYYELTDTSVPALHLCKLYITPNAYASAVDIVKEINTKLYNSFYNLFKIHTISELVYGNQQFSYQVLPDWETRTPTDVPTVDSVPSVFSNYGIQELRNAVITEAELRNGELGEASVFYYIPGQIRYIKNNILYIYSNCIIEFTNVFYTDVSVYNGTINLPFFYDPSTTTFNQFSTTKSKDGSYNIFQGIIPGLFSHASGVGDNWAKYSNVVCNVLRTATIENVVGINCNIWSDGKQIVNSNESIDIETAVIDNFEVCSNIMKDTNRFRFQSVSTTTHELENFVYQYAFKDEIINPDLKIVINIASTRLALSGDGLTATVDWNTASDVNISILNPSGKNPIALSGFELACSSEGIFPLGAETILNGRAIENVLPGITFTSTEAISIDTSLYYSLTITLEGTFQEEVEEWEIDTLKTFVYDYAYGVRIKKIKDDMNNWVQNEIPDVYGVDVYRLYKKSYEVVDGERVALDNEWEQGMVERTVQFNQIQISPKGENTQITVVEPKGTITRKVNNPSTDSVDYYWNIFDRKYYLKAGTVSAGILYNVPIDSSSLSNLYTLSTAVPSHSPVQTITANANLTYDTYYYKAYQMIKQAEEGTVPTFVALIQSTSSAKLTLKWFLPIIPITSESIYTNTLNFLEVMKDPNFELKFNTSHLQPILSYTGLGDEQVLTTNTFKLSKYSKQNNNIDDYYYNFSIDEQDLWSKLGFTPCKIRYDRTTIMSYNSSHKADESSDSQEVYPVYLIKGVYYSECLYNGPLYTNSTIKIESYEENVDISNIKSIMLPANYDITKLMSTNDDLILFNTYFNKTTHYAERLMDLSVPKTIEVKITQNKDIEEYLNSNEIEDSIANLGQYKVVRENEPTIQSIQQELELNTTIQIPDDNPVYVYLTNGNQIYSLMDTVATLNVEYIN